MKKNKILTIIFAACLMLSGISCIRQEMEVAFDNGDNLERVRVNLSLDVTRIEDGTPGTKGLMEPEADATDTDSQIKDFVVLQFNGTTSSAQLVGGQVYFDHWPLNGYRATTDPLYDENDVLTLVASVSANTVVVLANTLSRISITNSITLGDFLASDYTTISGLSGVFATSGGNNYLRLSGSTKLNTVSIGDNVSVSLKRNVAKIVVNVTNATHDKTGDNKVNLSKVHLRDVNGKYYYLAHVDAALAPLTFTDTYNSADRCMFDNDMEDFPAAKNPGGASQGTAEQYVYYVPANLRGTTGSTAQSTKAVGAPEGSTYFSLYGTYGTSNTPIVYTYYLGENLTNDFNLKPNYKYTYNITISTKGNADYDHCIEDLKEIRFATDANCYMVHPPKVEGQTRLYSFPVRRAAAFWNTEAQGGLYGANTMEGYGTNVLTKDTPWTAEIIWSDFDMSAYMSGASKFLAIDSGTGYDPLDPAHTQPYIKVRISQGMCGNVVVGMKCGSVMLWSWHIWITDYDPDVPMTPVAHQYIYSVPGGEIHRYNNDKWNAGGEYENGFSMDRNLGAHYIMWGTGKRTHLFYQWGRKDPFTCNTVFYLGGTTSAYVINSDRQILNSAIRADYKNIRYSVTHPTVYIYGDSNQYNWYSADDIGSAAYRWGDPKWNRTGDPDRHESKKSIYDPCPPGWKVPVLGIWAGFDLENESNTATQTYTTTWSTAADYYGRYYYPEGYVNRAVTGSIFFPESGTRAYTSGGLAFNSARYWSSTYSDLARQLYFDSTSVSPNSGITMTIGDAVRCIRE